MPPGRPPIAPIGPPADIPRAMEALTLDWLTILILLGAAQGCFLAAVLATQRRNRTANRILAVAVFAFSIQMISVVYHAVGFEQVFPHFFGAAYPLPMLYGPLIYLYAVTAGDRARRLQRWDWLHFVPFVVVVAVGLPIYLMSGAEKIAFHRQMQAGFRPVTLQVIDSLKYVSGVAYTVATIVFLQRHRRRVEDSYSTLERVNLRWLLLLAGGGAVVWTLALAFHLTDILNLAAVGQEDDVVALALAIMVYAIGYMALRQPEVFTLPTGEWRAPTPSVPPPPPAPSARYERSGLSPREAGALKERLLALVDQDHLYRDSALTLNDLAGRLGTTPHKLSEILNAQLGQSFYDFVNGYRVREVQRRMADDRSQHLTLLSLALDAGFASKSTFNHVFKKQVGQTPTEYRRRLGG